MATKKSTEGTELFVGIKGDEQSYHKVKGKIEYYQGKDGKIKPEVEDKTSPAMVVSRLDHPTTITYNGESLVIPPRGREQVANLKKLGAIPKGITVVPLN